MDLFEELRWRGMLQDATEGAEEALRAEPRSVYVGFDPTADSLHIGNLVPVMGLVHAQRAGHAPIVLVGGGTGLIGDPSGKTEERRLMSKDEVRANAEAIRRQLAPFLSFEGAPNAARMDDNLDWLGETRLIDFLRDVGKHFPVSAMLRRDNVRRRLGEEGGGITYTEFSYVLLQSYDFLRLFQDLGCRFQFGGQDQWGNITGGIDLIRRVTGERAYGLVFPLVTTASGVKFGKTEAGAVWLSAERTSPYRFYQYWLNVDDADVGMYLRFFTLLSRDEIEALEAAAASAPHERAAQYALAREVTGRVHGETGLARARSASEALFGGEMTGLAPDEIEEIFADVPSGVVGADALGGGGMGIVELLAATGVTPSKGEARRAVEQGGIYLNNQRVTDLERTVTLDDTIGGRFLVIRRGKRRYHLVRMNAPA